MAKINSAGNGSKFKYSILEADVYEARVTRFVFVGVQPQRAFQGQEKPDTLQAKVAFELIGETVTVTDGDGKEETRPAVVFMDINVGAAGLTRGKAFDLINAGLGAEETFDDTALYKDVLNTPVAVTVGTYEDKRTGDTKNCVNGVGPMGKRAKEKLEDSTVDNIFFDSYEDTEGMKEVFAGLGNFVQDTIKKAKDSNFIPAVKDSWPTSIEDKAADKEENEF
jgi:hypothetical protein